MTGSPVGLPWRRALVTGASSGIGAEMARQLAAAGVDLVVVARRRDRLDALAAEATIGRGVEVEVVVADLGDRAQLARVEGRLADDDRPIDLLVNSAGYGLVGDVAELDINADAAVVAVNVVALQRLSHAAASAMVARGSGAILNVSSVAGFRPAARSATYGATKAFVTGFSGALAAELAPLGVTVTCLCPGLTRTEFHQRAGYDTSTYPRWAWQRSAVVAAAGLGGAARGKVTVVPGLHNKAARHLMSLAPTALIRLVDRRVRPGNRSYQT